MRSASAATALLLLAGTAAIAAEPAPLSASAQQDAASTAEARSWIERMNTALASRNYHGVFVHQHGKRRETLRIIHRVQDGKVSERLLSIDGSGREFVRNGADLACYFPDRQVVIMERRPQEKSFIDGLPGIDARTADNYDIRLTSSRSMEGRATRLVELTPRDDYRYGYKLWIDEKTAMPIKTQMCDSRGNVIEQIEFASLRMPATIDDALLQPAVAATGFRWIRHESPPARAPLMASGQTLQLPPGFRMSARTEQGPMSHLVFTDGVASVSVFIESNVGGRPPADDAQMGSAAAFSTLADGRRITAVGEVPPLTVRYIAQAMQSSVSAQAGQSAAATNSAASNAATSGRSSETRSLRQAVPAPALDGRRDAPATLPGFAGPERAPPGIRP